VTRRSLPLDRSFLIPLGRRDLRQAKHSRPPTRWAGATSSWPIGTYRPSGRLVIGRVARVAVLHRSEGPPHRGLRAPLAVVWPAPIAPYRSSRSTPPPTR